MEFNKKYSLKYDPKFRVTPYCYLDEGKEVVLIKFDDPQAAAFPVRVSDLIPEEPTGVDIKLTYFQAWIEDGNAICRQDGFWCTQDAQYKNSLTLEGLMNYFIKEFGG
jgi:hypothetical protein